MSWGAIKRTAGDAAFSDYIRARANWTCERCHRVFAGPHSAIHNSHFFTRANVRVRFDPDNCFCLCAGCHDWFGKNPHDHSEFVRRRLGEDRYNALVVRANTRRSEKLDHKFEAMKWRAALKDLKKQQDGKIVGSRS